MLGKSVELARGRENHGPPSIDVWKALADPMSDEIRGLVWFRPLDDEQVPEIAKALEPSEVVWRSLWPDRPDLRVAFDIQPQRLTNTRGETSENGCVVTWVLRGPDGSLDADDLERRARRLRHLVRLHLPGLWSH